ncbi:MAG: hypothetical protein AB1762_04830 [Gemmatimonadota bacterium]
MSLQRTIELYAAIHLFVIGLSHTFQPRVWVEFFIHLRQLGHTGVFVTGFMSLYFGSIIVAFHNVWSGLPLVLTILGWSQLVKALLYFVVPSVGARAMSRVSMERRNEFIAPGILFLVLAALMLYLALRGT